MGINYEVLVYESLTFCVIFVESSMDISHVSQIHS